MNFNGKKGFLKGYFRRKKGFKSEKKVFPRLILHSRCFEKNNSERSIHFISCKVISIIFERECLDLPSTNNK